MEEPAPVFQRPTSRILVLDPGDRILLFFGEVGYSLEPHRRPDATGFWMLPGGGVDPGESHDAAASRELWEETLGEFRERGQRAAAARSHAKVVTLDTRGGRYALEGSANLRTNGNREQFALFHDAALHDWPAAWIDDMVGKHEGDPGDGPAPR